VSWGKENWDKEKRRKGEMRTFRRPNPEPTFGDLEKRRNGDGEKRRKGEIERREPFADRSQNLTGG
jgi:hypothetical protein